MCVLSLLFSPSFFFFFFFFFIWSQGYNQGNPLVFLYPVFMTSGGMLSLLYLLITPIYAGPTEETKLYGIIMVIHSMIS